MNPTQNPPHQEPHPLCGAKTKQGTPCRATAGRGTNHLGIGQCKHHGGRTPSANQHAQKELARREATRFGARTDLLPAEALLELVQTKAGEVAYWQARVEALNETELAGLLLAHDKQNALGSEKMFKAGVHVFVKALHEAQDQLARYSEAAIRAGASETLVKLVTRQAEEVIAFGRACINMARNRPDMIPDDIIRQLVGERTPQ